MPGNEEHPGSFGHRKDALPFVEIDGVRGRNGGLVAPISELEHLGEVEHCVRISTERVTLLGQRNGFPRQSFG
ncbi:MAG: hypothetical protein M3R37_09160, partial [Actinomycetota bacterium]|nr:hypothetical protein [Actinomycetota bacterium]